jgi:hypothetical protein
MYRLKPAQPNFTVVDGPFTDRAYRRGRTYPEIPPEYASRFEEMIDEESKADGETGRGGDGEKEFSFQVSLSPSHPVAESPSPKVSKSPRPRVSHSPKYRR